jgi:hypothetical protein
LKTQLKTFGFIFECMCVRDLKVYSAQLGGEFAYTRPDGVHIIPLACLKQ